MVDATDELNRFAAQLGITTSAAGDLLARLRELNNSSNNTITAFDVTRTATQGMAAEQRNAMSSLGNLNKTTQQVTSSFANLPNQISGANGQIFTSITPALNAIGQLGSIIPTITSSLGAAMSSFVGGPLAKMVGGAMGKFLGELGEGGLTKLISITNVVLSGAEDIIKSYFALSENGMTFAGSLVRLNNLVRDTGFSLQFLTKVATKNAPNLAMLGGTAEGGLKTVINVTKKMSDELVTVYGGFENLSDEITQYLTLRRLQGFTEQVQSQNLVKDTTQYLYNLKLMSTLTGKTSKQLSQELAQRTKTAAMQQMLLDMTPEQRTNFQNQLLMIQDEATKAAYQDYVMAQHFGMAASAVTTKLMAITPGLEENFGIMKNAMSMQAEASNEITAKTYKNLAENAKLLRKETGFLLYGAESGRIQASVITDLNTFLTSIGQAGAYAEKLPESLKLASEAMSTLKSGVDEVKVLTGTVGGILRTQQELQTEINEFFLGPMFKDGKRIEGGRIQLVGAINEVLTSVIKDVIKTLNKTITEGLSFLSPTELQQETAGGGAAMVDPINAAIDRHVIANQEFNRQIENLTVELRKEQGRAGGERPAEITRIQRDIEDYKNQIEINNRTIEDLKNRQNNTVESVSQLDVLKLDSTDLAMASRGIFIKTDADTKLNINLSEFMEILTMMFDDQKRTNNHLADAMKDNAYNFKRLLDRIT
jgi:hypothetical protein